MNSTPRVFQFRILSNRKVVPKWIYDEVRKLALEFIPSMIPGHSYTAQTICGNSFWFRPVPGLTTLAGFCMADLVKSGELPLVFSYNGKKATLVYELDQ